MLSKHQFGIAAEAARIEPQALALAVQHLMVLAAHEHAVYAPLLCEIGEDAAGMAKMEAVAAAMPKNEAPTPVVMADSMSGLTDEVPADKPWHRSLLNRLQEITGQRVA